jgi:hypothetical protein
MVSHHVFSQLILFALVWLFVILHLTWPQPGVTAPAVPAEPKSLKPRRRRSTEPTAFAGLTKKPPCARCEQEVTLPQAPPAVPPAPMLPTHRRPRAIDTSQHFCPHWGCDYRGWRGLGNLRAHGYPSGSPWRPFYCTSCKGYFLETQGTLCHGKQAAVELIVRVLACLGACPRKKSLKNNVLELRRGDLKISPFPETRVLTGDQNFLIFSKNA